MNRANAKTVSLINPTVKKPATISDAQIDEIIFPDLSEDKFSLGDKSFRIRVLNFRWEKLFRRAAMPIIEQELKPFERMLLLFAAGVDPMVGDLGITRSIGQSEIDVDIFLTNSVVCMCMSQDPEILADQAQGIEMTVDKQQVIEKKYHNMVENLEDVPGGGGPRQYLREVVRKQVEKLKMVQSLGESLMARFAETGTLLGAKDQFDSLKQGFSQQVRKFTEKVGNAVATSANSSTPSMENISANPLTSPTKTENTASEPPAVEPSKPPEESPTLPA
jgi:hypothetical protein